MNQQARCDRSVAKEIVGLWDRIAETKPFDWLVCTNFKLNVPAIEVRKDRFTPFHPTIISQEMASLALLACLATVNAHVWPSPQLDALEALRFDQNRFNSAVHRPLH
jgi:hypothetical protein